MVNTGDTLTNVKVWKIKAVRQWIKPDLKFSLRSFLVEKGIAHSFFKEFMWLCPVDGSELEEEMINKLSKSILTRYEGIEINTIEKLTEVGIWHSLGIVLIRDALRYSLIEKFMDNRSVIVTPKREVYSKEFIWSGKFFGVVAGISLNKIFRMNDNVCICPLLIYECFDSMYRRVEDSKSRSRCISAISRIALRDYEYQMAILMKKILPLTVHLSNRKLYFNEWRYRILKKGEITLERWL